MQGKFKKRVNSEQDKIMFECGKCDETFESRGNLIDGNGTGYYEGWSVVKAQPRSSQAKPIPAKL